MLFCKKIHGVDENTPQLRSAEYLDKTITGELMLRMINATAQEKKIYETIHHKLSAYNATSEKELCEDIPPGQHDQVRSLLKKMENEHFLISIGNEHLASAPTFATIESLNQALQTRHSISDSMAGDQYRTLYTYAHLYNFPAQNIPSINIADLFAALKNEAFLENTVFSLKNGDLPILVPREALTATNIRDTLLFRMSAAKVIQVLSMHAETSTDYYKDIIEPLESFISAKSKSTLNQLDPKNKATRTTIILRALFQERNNLAFKIGSLFGNSTQNFPLNAISVDFLTARDILLYCVINERAYQPLQPFNISECVHTLLSQSTATIPFIDNTKIAQEILKAQSLPAEKVAAMISAWIALHEKSDAGFIAIHQPKSTLSIITHKQYLTNSRLQKSLDILRAALTKKIIATWTETFSENPFFSKDMFRDSTFKETLKKLASLPETTSQALTHSIIDSNIITLSFSADTIASDKILNRIVSAKGEIAYALNLQRTPIFTEAYKIFIGNVFFISFFRRLFYNYYKAKYLKYLPPETKSIEEPAQKKHSNTPLILLAADVSSVDELSRKIASGESQIEAIPRLNFSAKDFHLRLEDITKTVLLNYSQDKLNTAMLQNIVNEIERRAIKELSATDASLVNLHGENIAEYIHNYTFQLLLSRL